jgi:hypothetical protein
MKVRSELMLLQTFEEVLYFEDAVLGQIGAMDRVSNSIVAELSAEKMSHYLRNLPYRVWAEVFSDFWVVRSA